METFKNVYFARCVTNDTYESGGMYSNSFVIQFSYFEVVDISGSTFNNSRITNERSGRSVIFHFPRSRCHSVDFPAFEFLFYFIFSAPILNQTMSNCLSIRKIPYRARSAHKKRYHYTKFSDMCGIYAEIQKFSISKIHLRSNFTKELTYEQFNVPVVQDKKEKSRH